MGSGQPSPASVPPALPPMTGQPEPAEQRFGEEHPGIRKLIRHEYSNSVEDVFRSDIDMKDIPADSSVERLSNNANLGQIGYGGLETYLTLSERVSSNAVAEVKRRWCAGDLTEACVEKALSPLLRLTFRRPQSSEVVDAYLALFRNGTATRSTEDRLRQTVEAMVLSPHFLYRREGRQGQTLDGFEAAGKLSYLLWQSSPDEGLLDDAQNGNLETPALRVAAMKRLLAAPKGKVGLVGFLLDWLNVKNATTQTKQDAVRKGLSASVDVEMRRETTAFLEHVLFNATGTLQEVLAADYSFVPPALRELYGLPPSNDLTLSKVQLDRTQRRGVLTQGIVLTAHSKEIGESPIVFGKFLRENLLCQSVQLPPPTVNTTLPPADPTQHQSTRKRLETHAADATCRGCHNLFDPIGFAFLNFDPVGRYSPVDAYGDPYDTQGKLVAAVPESTFTSAVELADQLSTNRTVYDCFALQLWRWTHGRLEQPADLADIANIQDRFWNSRGHIVDAVNAIVESPTFVSMPPRRIP
jgi:Protein of unknown function (DUF1592)/Protein of unknown function (DUF1588)/Protein of unknown function (DUF1595)/Protein of unknown function (DUF1587)/Protein of unknown function (DUF1585)